MTEPYLRVELTAEDCTIDGILAHMAGAIGQLQALRDITDLDGASARNTTKDGSFYLTITDLSKDK